MSRLQICLFASLLSICSLIGSARETLAAYPERPLRIICAFGPGSGPDVISRYFAAKLETIVGKPVIVENRPGANAAIGTMATIGARPDGYTLTLLSTSTIAANPFLRKEIKYDALNDLMPITTLFRAASVVIVDSRSEVHTIQQLVERLRKKGGKANYPVDSPTFFTIAKLLFRHGGIKEEPVRISYKQVGEILRDLYTGVLDFATVGIPSAVPQAQAGRVRMIATTSSVRPQHLPDVPTLVESGFPEIVFEANWSAWLPKGTSPQIRETLESHFNQILQLDETKSFLARTGADVLARDHTELGRLLRQDVEKWAAISKLIDFSQEQ